MAGYYGYSMSNNAIEAYKNGEMPLSKWTKSAIISVINATCPEHPLLKQLSKLPAALLKKHLLINSSWHHTSKFYNKTDFWTLDKEALSSLDTATLQQWQDAHEETPKVSSNKNVKPLRHGIVTWKDFTYAHIKAYGSEIQKVQGWIDCANGWVTVYDAASGGDKILRKREWNVHVVYSPCADANIAQS